MREGSKFYLADGATLALVKSILTDENGKSEIVFDAGAGERKIEILPGEEITLEGGTKFKTASPSNKAVDNLTVTITATDIAEAFKEGFKMALGMEMMLGALGLDKEKVNQAIAQVGQIAVEAKLQLERIEKNQSEILEILRKAQDEHAGTKLIAGNAEAAKE